MYVLYKPLPGQRWDNVSQIHYATPYRYPEIVKENPAYNRVVSFVGGEVLRVPTGTEETVTATTLPPWKR